MKNYDVVIICFSDPNLDARTINLCKTLIKFGRKVALVTPEFGKDVDYIDETDYFKCKIDLSQRVRKSQKEFTRQVKELQLTAKYIHSGDFYSLSAAKYIKTRRGGNLIYDSREIYSKLNSLINRPLTQKIIELKEKYLVTYVDRMIVTAEEDAHYLKKHFMHSIPYSIIKNLPPSIELQESNKLRKQFGIDEDKLILLYQGWILEGRGLPQMITAMQNIEFAELVLIGEGNYLENLKSLVHSFNLSSKVHFTGAIDYAKLPEYTMSADVGLVLFENSSISYQNALPNKLFEFIQSGLPVLTSNQLTMRKIIENEAIGILLPNLEINTIIDGLKELADLQTREDFRQNVLKVRSKYNYETQEVELLKIFA